MSSQSTQTDIIIIGAGLSGLLALKKIVEEDKTKKVELYEALDRVGGRVYTYEKQGYKLDKGASWIGPTQTRMYDLVKEYNLKTTEQYEVGNNLIYFKGQDNYSEYLFILLVIANLYSLFTQSWFMVSNILIGSIALYLVYFKFLCDKKLRMVQKTYKGTIPSISFYNLLQFGIVQFKLDYHAKKINLEDPYSSPNAKQFDRMTLREWAMREFKGEDNPAYKTLLCATDTIFGVDLMDLSVLHTLFYIKAAGNLDMLMNTRGGAQQDRIVGGSSQIPLAVQKQLDQYIHLSSPVTKIDNSNPENIIVTFEKGNTRTCKRVIIAVPPQAISKTISITNIPQEKVKMMKAMQHGQLVKIFCVFKTPFWRDQGKTGAVLSPELQPNLIYDVSNEKNGILLSFLIYPHQKGYRDLSEDQRQEFILNHLGQFFGEKEIRENFLLFSDDNFTDEKYQQGCPVGVFGVDGWKLHGQFWKQPINNIFWAATETSTVWNGYMEGAVRAGERAAQEVLKSF
ncbi:hypothetical protein ABPG72_013845 [Tetrahymena utriculariae]